MTPITKYLTIIKIHGFLIWAILATILGLVITFRILGNDVSKKAGIVMTIIGIIGILYSLYSKKKIKS
jgi:membrane protein DedA with SNARE-associated domain